MEKHQSMYSQIADLFVLELQSLSLLNLYQLTNFRLRCFLLTPWFLKGLYNFYRNGKYANKKIHFSTKLFKLKGFKTTYNKNS
jgi:hypothetical protein